MLIRQQTQPIIFLSRKQPGAETINWEQRTKEIYADRYEDAVAAIKTANAIARKAANITSSTDGKEDKEDKLDCVNLPFVILLKNRMF
jgi:hypothetical protein